MHLVELNPGLPGTRRAWLRPLCGKDESLIQHGVREETLLLLQTLLVNGGEGALLPDRAPDLPVCDIDRLLASLYLSYVGDRIESTSACEACGKPFDISFSLRDLVDATEKTRAQSETDVVGPDEDGAFVLADGRRFRLPATRDLEAVDGITQQAAARALRRDCVLEGDPEQDPEALEEAMAAVGPVLDTDLDAVCPSCDNAQQVRFEMQRFFGRALAFERQFLSHEVHQLARAYGWQRSEILAMPRDDRRAHVRIILAERSATSRHHNTTHL